MQITLREIGNSLGSIFPKPMIQSLGLQKGDKINITEEGGRLVIEPVKKPKYSLSELLGQCKSCTPELSQEDKDWLNSEPVGKELL